MEPRRKMFLFRTVLVLVPVGALLALLEFAAHRIMIVKQYNFYLPLELDAEHVSRVQGQFATTFDRDLGWEPVPLHAGGYLGPERDASQAAIALFGDSYTEGYPVFEESWAGKLAEHLGRPVLNFGVGGYGTDQAYLRFEKRYAGKLDTPYVCLGVMSENTARIVNRYRGFYARKAYLNGVKPRFELDGSGELRLIPTPLESAAELPRLLDPAFRAEIGATDYWYRYYERLGMNQVVHRPYAWFLVRALPFYVRTSYQKRVANYMDYMPLYDDPEVVSLMEAILRRFVARAAAEGAVPIILFFPNWKDCVDQAARGTTVYDGFYRRIRDLHPDTRDAMDYFAPGLGRGDPVASLFKSYADGHYNPDGERIVAAGFYADLVAIDAEHGRLGLSRAPAASPDGSRGSSRR